MSHTSQYIHFDFDETYQVRPELQKCSSRSPCPPISDIHVKHLDALARKLGFRSHDPALQNARSLATGSTDLVVLLLEPSDKEATSTYDDMALKDYPRTIQILDASLKGAFNQVRGIHNTIILDTRSLRFRGPRQSEMQEIRDERDADAYGTLNDMLSVIRPKVIVVCQCEKDDDALNPRRHSDLGLPEILCSSVGKSGRMKYWQSQVDHECVIVYSYHPMYIERGGKDAPYAIPRRLLFDANLVQAANALIGREMAGEGMDILQRTVQDKVSLPDGISRYPRLRPEDYPPPTVLERVEELGLMAPYEASVNRCPRGVDYGSAN